MTTPIAIARALARCAVADRRALVPSFDVVAKALVGLAIHDPIALRRASVREPSKPAAFTWKSRNATLFSTSRLRPAISMICRAVRPVNRKIGRLPMVATGAKVWISSFETTGAESAVCTACTFTRAKRAPLDPDGAAVERAGRDRRGSNRDHVAVVVADALGAGEPVAIVAVEAQLQRQRQDLLGLEQRKRRPVGSPLRAVDRERQLFPLDVVAGHEVAVLARHVVPGIGHGRPEVLIHPHGRRCSCGRERPGCAAAAGAAR